MQRSSPKAIGIISICFLFILACTPTGQRSTEAPSAGDKAVVKETETIKIGLIAPFSGPFRTAGPWQYKRLRFAVEEQNARGGLLGKQIEIIKEDHEFKSDVGIRKAPKLILEDKVNFIASGAAGQVSLALNSVATKYKTILIHSLSEFDIIQGKEFSRYAFRVNANGHSLNCALAQLMATKPYRKFFIICPDWLPGHEHAKNFKKQIIKYIPDAQIVGEDYHVLGVRKFDPYIANVKATKAEVVYYSGITRDALELIRQARAQGLKAPFSFVIPWADTIPMALGYDAVGIHNAAAYSMMVDTPENKAMIAKYHKQHEFDKLWLKWPHAGVGATILGWQMFFTAVEKAGSLEPEKIIETFEGFRYKTIMGWWAMRECDHQVITPMFGMVIKAGPNPYFSTPWYGPDIVKFFAEETAIPATSDYNPRCP